jgi:hypothetical protein
MSNNHVHGGLRKATNWIELSILDSAVTTKRRAMKSMPNILSLWLTHRGTPLANEILHQIHKVEKVLNKRLENHFAQIEKTTRTRNY